MDNVNVPGVGVTVVEKVELVLGKIAETLGQGAEYFWPVFVRQQTIDAIASLVILMILLVAAFVGAKYCVRSYKSSEWGNDGPDNLPAVATIIFATMTFACTVAFLASMGAQTHNIITGLVNPEYSAVHNIIDMVKGAK